MKTIEYDPELELKWLIEKTGVLDTGTPDNPSAMIADTLFLGDDALRLFALAKRFGVGA